MYILKVYSVTIDWDKTQILKKSPSNKINGTKKSLFFLLRTPTNQSFTFHGFLLKLCAGFIFVQQNAWTLTLKRHNSFQNQNNRKATHSFATIRLIFRLQ